MTRSERIDPMEPNADTAELQAFDRRLTASKAVLLQLAVSAALWAVIISTVLAIF